MTVQDLIDVLGLLKDGEDLWIEINGSYERLHDLEIDYFDKAGLWISDRKKLSDLTLV